MTTKTTIIDDLIVNEIHESMEVNEHVVMEQDNNVITLTMEQVRTLTIVFIGMD